MDGVRVVHLTTHLGRGGAAANVLLACLGLARSGFEVTLLAGPAPDRDEDLFSSAVQAGVRIREIPSLVRNVSPLRDLRAGAELRRALRRARPRLVHTHQSKAGFLGRRVARSLAGASVLHTPHGHVFDGYFSPIVTELFVRLERRAATWCDRLIGLTQKEVQDHLARGVGQPEQWRVVHSGVELERVRSFAERRVDVRAALGLPAAASVLASLGRLEPVKGLVPFLPVFAEAAREEPGLHWAILGEGTERERLEKEIAAFGLSDRVRPLGWLEEPWGLLAGCDALVCPSLNEGMGRSVVEALALGLPVFASDAGSLSELMADGSRGGLFSWKDASEVRTRKLLDFARRLPFDAAERAALMVAANRYSSESALEASIACYRELLEV